MPLLAAGARYSSREHVENCTANLCGIFIDLGLNTALLVLLDRDVR